MARTDFILTIVNLEGESRSAQQETSIDVLSWSWGETAPPTRSRDVSRMGGKVSMDDFTFKMLTNVASPHLMFACASGQNLPKATLTCRKAGPRTRDEIYLKYTMEDVYVSSYRPTGAMESAPEGGGVIPIEEFTLNFGKVIMEYRAQKDDGSLGGTIKKEWDLRLNRP